MHRQTTKKTQRGDRKSLGRGRALNLKPHSTQVFRWKVYLPVSPVKNASRQRPALSISGASSRTGMPSRSHAEITSWRIAPRSTPEGAVQTAPSSSTTKKFEVKPAFGGPTRGAATLKVAVGLRSRLLESARFFRDKCARSPPSTASIFPWQENLQEVKAQGGTLATDVHSFPSPWRSLKGLENATRE